MNWPRWFVALLCPVLFAACAGPDRVAVEERSVERPIPIQSPAVGGATYVVKRGETLFAIARRHGITAQELQQLNRIDDPSQLEIGDRLLLPRGVPHAPQSATVKSPYIWPLAGFTVTSAFGERGGRHKGMDLHAKKGTPIRAIAPGTVYFSGRKTGYGKVVIVQHANNVRSLYAHNKKNKVKAGDRVTRGQTIATVGKSGNASGYHLHFEYVRAGRQLDPRAFLPAL
jgi:murein DD-endopeptidase MepM/ murein hydrolase activator NlpD